MDYIIDSKDVVIGQEIRDYKTLYNMFNDKCYKEKADKLEKVMDYFIEKIIEKSESYLMLNNTLEFTEESTATHYSTVIIKENKEVTLKKIWLVLNNLGEIEWMKFNEDTVEIKIKNGYKLLLFDYSSGVI